MLKNFCEIWLTEIFNLLLLLLLLLYETVIKHDNLVGSKGVLTMSGRVVKNIETGQIFKSINKAAKWAGCGATTLTRHLVRDKIAGKVPGTLQPAHWEELQ